jgi:ABC-type branched-subunit amino acid transport system permease subunit
VREFIIGASLILVLRFRPAGLLPERLPRMPMSLTSTPSPESR